MRDPNNWNEIRAWIDAHRDTLPRTFGELVKLPLPYRAPIVRALPPADRESIWREHFDTFLGDASPLTHDQQQFIREAIAELPTLMADDLGVAQAQAKELEQRIGVLFSRLEANRVFGSIGPPEPRA